MRAKESKGIRKSGHLEPFNRNNFNGAKAYPNNDLSGKEDRPKVGRRKEQEARWNK